MARSFNGTTSSLAASALPAGGVSYPFTMACWFRPTNLSNDHCLLALTDTAGNNDYHYLSANGSVGGDPLAATTKAGTTVRAQSTVSFVANTWQHACGVWESSTSRSVYLNGGNKGTNTTDRSPSGLDILSLGQVMAATPFASANAAIFFAAVWNIALSDAEVAQLCPTDPVSSQQVPVNPRFVRPGNIIFLAPLVDAPIDLKGLALTDNSTSVFANPRLIL